MNKFMRGMKNTGGNVGDITSEVEMVEKLQNQEICLTDEQLKIMRNADTYLKRNILYFLGLLHTTK